ncbi:MAG TPA: N-6 DNA methylase [Solirubrobacteraceae bacterium]|nr:N-6 DNA methylase [Solirubrobacteraceae bacterium]
MHGSQLLLVPPSVPQEQAPIGDAEREPNRKANGVYYTPPRLAQLLARWTLAGDPQRILEPAFGDGVFLEAADRILRETGAENAKERLHGVEVDPDGPRRVRERGLELIAEQLHEDDLLSLDTEQLGGGFDAILGNPPYIRHHLLSEEMASRGRLGGQRLGIDLNGRSDAWAYFCAHLVRFLNPGGRLALVLPGSVLHADYARPLLDALAAEEGEVQLIRISERLFPGVQERTVLLLIDRAKPSGGRVVYRRIAGLDGLARALRNGSPGRVGGASATRTHHDPRLPWRLRSAEATVWEKACADEHVVPLGTIAKTLIGVVTGANAFFVRSWPEVEALGEGVNSVPIVSRGAWLAATSWTRSAQSTHADEPSRLILFPPRTDQLSAEALAELSRGKKLELHKRSHCAKREAWYSIVDTLVPDLFLPYMGSRPHWLVVNDAAATCTNTIHRVWLHPETGLSAQSIAAASWTTLYRLSAELHGRSYGGGVLKLEPSGASRLQLPALESPGLLEEIERARIGRGAEAAQSLADQRLLVEGMGLSEAEVATLREATARLEALRRR